MFNGFVRFCSQDSVNVLGTIRWMAPELCTPPPERSSYLSDVWSYGCIILEILTAREPWIEQYNDDNLLFRALQHKENTPSFTRFSAHQSGPAHLCQLLMQCCAWSKTDRPTFANILQKFTTEKNETTLIDEYADCMSVDSFIANEQSSFQENGDVSFDNNNEKDQPRLRKVPANLPKSINDGGRLTGEVYTSSGTANGRSIYEGVKGGLYYLTASGSKVYLHK